MSSPRENFLRKLFALLDQRSIGYCVLRNYEDLYTSVSSDIDLVIEPQDLDPVKACLAESSRLSGHRFVHQARYVNYSYVYWHAEGGFIRVDLETEIRWRVFPVLTAKAVIGLRRTYDDIYIPSARHESVILFVAAVWRRNLSERYRTKLEQLYQELNEGELKRTFVATFGKVGRELAECQARMKRGPPPNHLWQRARKSLIGNSISNGPNRRALLRYLAIDAKRLVDRLTQPAGISLLYASSGSKHANPEDLLHGIDFLYPRQKFAVRSFVVSTHDNGKGARLTWRLRTERFWTLFKGGVFMRFYEVNEDHRLARIVREHARYLYPSRTFICASTSQLGHYLAHVQTGYMAELPPSDDTASASRGLLQFISEMLEQQNSPPKGQVARRGVFMVLVGLDGSGKTSVARAICCLGTKNPFPGVRYFHWQPRLRRSDAIPLPDFKETPRKTPSNSAVQRALSIVRLLKNLVLTRIAYWVRVLPLLKRGTLVMIDRYFYNYFLDPVSVRYSGPTWLLEQARRLFPKPDLVVVLQAPAEVLRRRKAELSEQQIVEQNQVLARLQFNAEKVIRLDATLPLETLVATIIRESYEEVDS